MVVARWEGALDLERARAVLAAGAQALAEGPEAVADALAEGVPRCPSLPFRSQEGKIATLEPGTLSAENL